jgi:hypothetical protein
MSTCDRNREKPGIHGILLNSDAFSDSSSAGWNSVLLAKACGPPADAEGWVRGGRDAHEKCFAGRLRVPAGLVRLR